jgi:hypothetical protein
VSLWASLFGDQSVSYECSEEAAEVLEKLEHKTEPLRHKASEERQDHDSGDEVSLPRKRGCTSEKCAPDKRQRAEITSVRKTLATQTQPEAAKKTQTEDALVCKPRTMPRLQRDSPFNFPASKQLSLMRFAMRLPELSTEQLRSDALKEEFSKQYEATLPFYRSSQDLKPASPAKLPEPIRSTPQSVVSEPVAAEQEAEGKEEVDSCTTTPEQTPEKPKVEVPVLKLSKDPSELKEVSPKPEPVCKPFCFEEESKKPIHQKVAEVPQKPSEPEVAHPKQALTDQFAFSKLQEVKPPQPDNPFLRPFTSQSTEPKLPYVFGSASVSTPNKAENTFLPVLAIPAPNPVTEKSLYTPAPANPFLFSTGYSQPFLQTPAPSYSTPMEVEMVSSPQFSCYAPPAYSPSFPSAYAPMMSMETMQTVQPTPIFTMDPFANAPMSTPYQPPSGGGSFSIGNVRKRANTKK